MDYTKQNFQSGNILTAAELNLMDNQIYENATQLEQLNANIEDLNSGLENKQNKGDYVLTTEYVTKINDLESQLAALQARIAALEPTEE